MQTIVIALLSLGALWVIWNVKDWLIDRFSDLKRYVKEDEQFNKEFRSGDK